MRRIIPVVVAVLAAVSLSQRGGLVVAQEGSGLGGRWALNRELSQFPREVGFTPNWMPGLRGGATGGRDAAAPAPGIAGALPPRPESEDDARRTQLLTWEVRTPPSPITITDTPTAVSITGARGETRTFHPDGRDVTIKVDDLPVVVNARREAGRLVVSYKLDATRELRYTFTRPEGPPRLLVDIQFLERGKGDVVKRVYDPATDDEAAPPPGERSPAAPPRPSPGAPDAAAPAAAGQPVTFDQRPDAALRGLRKVGLVVEDLSAQAATCGLNQATIEKALGSQLSTAGFTVSRYGDEDTYFYVDVITTSASSSLCVSRYDVSLTSHAVATLAHQDKPVLVEVSLLHKGGLSGGPAATHGQAVLRGIQEFLASFVTQIENASK
jgi:hypothetical protein